MNPHRCRTDVYWTFLTPRSGKRKKMAVASLRSKQFTCSHKTETVISAVERQERSNK